MPPSRSVRSVSRQIAVSVTSGLLLLGYAAAPASADTTRDRQWHLTAMKAEEVWEKSTGSGLVVAVIDSGVDPSNGDLKGRVLKGLDLALDSPGDARTDYSGHGTGMAGLIAGTGQGNGGDGAFGLAPAVKILPIRMRDDAGRVNGATGDANFNRDVPVAIRYAVDHGAKVINISLGNETGSQRLTDSVQYALLQDSLIFASVGNTGNKENAVEYPAGTPGVVGVGAIGRDLKKTDWSQFGPQVDLSAPGVDMIHACGGETGLCKGWGTSDATAIASASAALIWSKHPDWTNNQVLRVMLNTAGGPTNGDERSDYIGYGIVRPRVALESPGDPGPADVYPLPDLAEAESAVPTPPAKSSAAAGKPAGDGTSAAPVAAAGGGSGNTVLGVALGVGAAALVGGGVGLLVTRARRRKAAVAPPPTPDPHGYPYSSAQAQAQTQPTYPQPTQPPPPGYGPGPQG